MEEVIMNPMLKVIIGIACLLLLANSQIIRLNSFQPCAAPTVNPQLAALHRVMASISNNPLPTPTSFGSALPPLSNGLPNALPFFPNSDVRPNPLPILPGGPTPHSGPKLCSCGHHYVNDPIRPAQPAHTPVHQEEDSSSDSSEEDSSRVEGRKCRKCVGKDCKCSVHKPRHHRPKPRPLIKKNGKTCDKCKGGKCECSDCKCANCREDDSNRGPAIKPVLTNLLRH